MRRVRAIGSWLADWRTGAVLLGSLIAGAVIAFVIVSGVNSHDALQARTQTAKSATRRIDKLTSTVTGLQERAKQRDSVIGGLSAQVAVLQEQVRQMGGRPVVLSPPTTTPAPRTTTRPSGRSTTTTAPRPTSSSSATSTTTTAPPRCLLVLCG